MFKTKSNMAVIEQPPTMERIVDILRIETHHDTISQYPTNSNEAFVTVELLKKMDHTDLAKLAYVLYSELPSTSVLF